MCDAASCRIVGIGLAARIVIVRSFDLVSSAIWLNGKSHTIRNGDFITIRNIALGSARTARSSNSSRNLTSIIGHNGFHNDGSILHIRLGSGVPGGLALVQVDRDGHGGKDAEMMTTTSSSTRVKPFSPLARRLSALRTLFIMNPSFQLEGHTVGPSNFGWSTAILLCVISPCGGGWLT